MKFEVVIDVPDDLDDLERANFIIFALTDISVDVRHMATDGAITDNEDTVIGRFELTEGAIGWNRMPFHGGGAYWFTKDLHNRDVADIVQVHHIHKPGGENFLMNANTLETINDQLGWWLLIKDERIVAEVNSKPREIQ
jgi:hypothetical protein